MTARKTDLDLGHYERFHQCQAFPKTAVLPPGKVYLFRDHQGGARGDYLGKTVQIIPHITDEIKERI